MYNNGDAFIVSFVAVIVCRSTENRYAIHWTHHWQLSCWCEWDSYMCDLTVLTISSRIHFEWKETTIWILVIVSSAPYSTSYKHFSFHAIRAMSAAKDCRVDSFHIQFKPRHSIWMSKCIVHFSLLVFFLFKVQPTLGKKHFLPLCIYA